jgi:cytolysin (calcineurin-like family phosphatase)
LLYTSAWFQKVRDIVEASGARWFILSARYGLVAPNAEIEPYERTLNTLGVAERRAWASAVLDKLLPELTGENRVVMFAGDRYREFLVVPLRSQGIKVEVPMANLAFGQQLAWLS